jgi:hypothetical protein
MRGLVRLRTYSYKKPRDPTVLKLSTLLDSMHEYARAGYESFTPDELRQILYGHGYDVPQVTLSQMLDCLVTKGHVERTVSGLVQLTN